MEGRFIRFKPRPPSPIGAMEKWTTRGAIIPEGPHSHHTAKSFVYDESGLKGVLMPPGSIAATFLLGKTHPHRSFLQKRDSCGHLNKFQIHSLRLRLGPSGRLSHFHVGNE